MLQTSLAILVTLAIALGGGVASVWYALGALGGVGAMTVANWTAYPFAGTPEADPYSEARSAREGALPLGRSEGIAFVAERDTSGRLLSRQCSYLISGQVPPARFWTLYAADGRQHAIVLDGQRPNAVSSFGAIRQEDSSIAVAVGPSATPGNWLQVTGTGEMRLILTLYDTPAAASGSVDGVDLPRVLRTGCNG